MYDAPFVCLLPFPYLDFLIFGANHVMMFGQAGMADDYFVLQPAASEVSTS